MNTTLSAARLVCCLCAIASLLAPGGVRAGARAGEAEDVDAFVAARMREQSVPGLSIAVVREGKVVLAKGYGLANVETNAPATADTVYRLASLTKQFTAAAVMLLVQDGKVGLDDRVSRYLDPSPAAWREITIRQLLTHTSGIKDHLNAMNAATCHGTTPEEIVAHVGEMPLDFAPGTAASYTNTGYLVLGMVVRKASGKPFDEFLAERVFRPLGMTSTRRNSLDEIVPNRAAGYVLRDGRLRNSPYAEPTLYDNADDGLVSSVADMAKWDAALRDDRILTKASRELMWTAAPPPGVESPFGFGWLVERVNGRRLVYHLGTRADTAAYFARYVDDGLTVIVLANREGAGVGAIARHVAGIYVPAVAGGDRAIEDAEPEVTALVRRALVALRDGTADASPFTPEMWKQMGPEVLAYLRKLLAPGGELERLDLLERSTKDGRRAYRYRAAFATRAVTVELTISDDGRIADMGVTPE